MCHTLKLGFLTVARAYLFPGIREYPRGSFLVEPQELASSQSENAPQNQAFDLEERKQQLTVSPFVNAH